MTEHEYSQGICQDGAAVLKNGQPMTIEQILEELRAGQSARAQGEPEPMIPTGRYTVEPHGKGYAIYRGRDMDHHGENLGHLSDCLPYLPNMVEKVLNGQARPEYTVDREFLVQLLADRQKRIDSLEKDLNGALAESVQAVANKVCGDLPDGWEINLCMENGAAWVEAIKPSGYTIDIDGGDLSLVEQINDALEQALPGQADQIEAGGDDEPAL